MKMPQRIFNTEARRNGVTQSLDIKD